VSSQYARARKADLALRECEGRLLVADKRAQAIETANADRQRVTFPFARVHGSEITPIALATYGET